MAGSIGTLPDLIKEMQDRKNAEEYWWLDSVSPERLSLHAVNGLVAKRESPYGLIEVADAPGRGLVLLINGVIQLAELDEFIYHELLVHPAMAQAARFRGPELEVLVVGGGDGCAVREVLRWPGVRSVTLAELDPRMIACAREELAAINQGALEDPRVEIIIGNGLDLLASGGPAFDVIVMDLTDPEETGPAAELYSQATYEAARRRLNPGGMLVTHSYLLDLHPLDRIAVQVGRNVEQAFGGRVVYGEYIPSFEAVWTFQMACNSQENRDLQSFCGGLPAGLRYYGPQAHVRAFNLPGAFLNPGV